MRATFVRGHRSLLVGHAGRRGRGIVEQLRHRETDELVPGKSSPHEREEGPRRHGGQRDWRGWWHRANGWRR